MKTLIFNGSPRKNGDTVSLINQLTYYLEGDIKIVNAYYCNISPCIDCRFCYKNKDCCQNDEMQEIYQYIKDCDNIVIASPIYFSELTGPLLSVLSRLQTYYCARMFRNEIPIEKTKNGMILLVGGGDGSMDKALSTATTLLHQMNVKTIYPEIVFHNTNLKKSIDDTDTLLKIKKTAEKINQLNTNTDI